MNKKPAPPITLKSVQQAFAAWRRTRPSKRSRIPRHLLEQAAKPAQIREIVKLFP